MEISLPRPARCNALRGGISLPLSITSLYSAVRARSAVGVRLCSGAYGLSRLAVVLLTVLAMPLTACADRSIRRYELQLPAVSHASASAALKLNWTLPPNWQLRRAAADLDRGRVQFTIGSDRVGQPGAAVVSLSVYDIQRDFVVLHVNRWRAQLGLAPIYEPQQLAAAMQQEQGASGTLFLWCELHNEQRDDQSLLGALFLYPQRIVAVKFRASPAVLAAQREAFFDFNRQLSSRL